MNIRVGYFYSNYFKRHSVIIKTIHEIDNALTLCESNNTIKSLQKSRQLLCDEFSNMCKDIEIKDGIKTIDKNFIYYCNGLVEYKPENIVTTVNPFQYQFNKKPSMVSMPNPEYNSFFRYSHGSPYRAYRDKKEKCMPRSVSILINDYLFYKADIKKNIKRPKLYDLINNMEKFIKLFDIDIANIDENIFNNILVKEVKSFCELNNKYNSAIYYAITGLYSNTTIRNNSSFYSRHEDEYNANFYNKRVGILDKRHTNCEIEIANTGDLYNKKYLRTERTILPYITESEAEKFLDIYNKSFNEYFNLYGLNNNSDIQQAENMAKDIAYDYYINNYHTQETDVYDESYDKLGFMCMYFKYSDNSNTKVMEYIEQTTYKSLELFMYNGIHIITNNHDYIINNKDRIIEDSISFVNSVKYMLLNIKELYRLLYTIPSQDMHDFLIKKKVIIENYCPDKEMITNTNIVSEEVDYG